MSVAVVGVDVGGTFTDFAVLRDGRLEVYKLPSTPSDPSRGILQGVSDLSVGEASYVHGSTVATNALLERRGARTALVTTHGFEDVLEIGRQNRPALYDLGVDRPPALVPAELRFGVSERVDQAGAVVATPRPEELSKLVSTLDDAQVDAVAVVLLFSFLNPLHEELVAEALAGLKSNPYVSVSSQVVPEFREYERTSTVVVNSYVGPLMSRYISQLEDRSWRWAAHHAVLGRQHHCPACLQPASAHHSQRSRWWRGGGLPLSIASWLRRRNHLGHGRDVYRRLPVPRRHQGDHLLQLGGLPHQRAHD